VRSACGAFFRTQESSPANRSTATLLVTADLLPAELPVGLKQLKHLRLDFRPKHSCLRVTAVLRVSELLMTYELAAVGNSAKHSENFTLI
jgi:hypothetical protein